MKMKDLVSEDLMFPTKEDVSGAIFSLMVLSLTYRFHPIKLVDGQLGDIETQARLSIEDVMHIINECLESKQSLFDSGQLGDSGKSNETRNITHYALAIEWTEAAER